MTDLISELATDVRYIKENMVTYREYDHLHNEFHSTKAKVDQMADEQHKRQWLVKLGERGLYVVLGAILIKLISLIGLEA